MKKGYEAETDFGYIRIYTTVKDFDGIADSIYRVDYVYCRGYCPTTTVTHYSNNIDDLMKKFEFKSIF